MPDLPDKWPFENTAPPDSRPFLEALKRETYLLERDAFEQQIRDSRNPPRYGDLTPEERERLDREFPEHPEEGQAGQGGVSS